VKRSPFDWIEEATHLLSAAPASTLARFYIGFLPFALALLWFWLDMSHNAFAEQRLEVASCAMATLFVWMKCWQTGFAGGLLLVLNGEAEPAWNLRRVARLAMQQAAIQPTAYLLLPAAALTVVPLARVVGFYQNACLLGSGEDLPMGELFRRSKALTSHWAREVWVILLILMGFGLFVFVNAGSLLVLIPQLAKMLLGIESVFTLNSWAMINSTYFLTCTLIAYSVLDPLLKACYVLRCFYGEAQTTAADLRAELRNLA
jgi:hypothetical protein